MARQLFVFRSPDRFHAGTVGQPGDREFFVQAIDGARVITVGCEKQQVAILADRLDSLVGEVTRRFGASPEEAPVRVQQADRLQMPVDSEFRVGTMGLAWDGAQSTIIVELLALTDQDVGEDVVLEDRDDAPDALRVYLSLAEAQAFAQHAQQVVAAGRPSCPLCGNPLDPAGHICPRLNGYHRGQFDT